MPETGSRRSLKELERHGEQLYDRRVRPSLRPEDDGKFVAIDVVSAEYEMDADDYTAVTRLHARVPSADVWLMRVGAPTAYVMRSPRWQ
jgi:hypothetical protein